MQHPWAMARCQSKKRGNQASMYKVEEAFASDDEGKRKARKEKKWN
jgi:hypothetical protein